MRVPQPFFRKFTSTWYVQIGKKQINLGKDEKRAWDKYYELMGNRDKLSPTTYVVHLLDSYLDWCQRERNPKTYNWYKTYIGSFAKFVGKRLTLVDLRPHHVTKWSLEVLGSRSPTTRHDAMSAVKRAFSWGRKQGYISTNPVENVETPTPERRETIITPGEYKALLGHGKDSAFHDLTTFFWETGARPQEGCWVEARHVEPGRIVFPTSESKGRRFPRVIYLTDAAEEIVKRRMKEQGQGPVFRNTKGVPWCKNSLNCRFRRLKPKMGVPGLCCYTLRHSYATYALQNGVDSVTLSVLMRLYALTHRFGYRTRLVASSKCYRAFGWRGATRMGISRGTRRELLAVLAKRYAGSSNPPNHQEHGRLPA